MARTISPYDQRFAQREISRMQGLDVGSDTGALAEDSTDLSAREMPTLQSMTNEVAHPPIALVGVADAGRVQER